MGAKKILKLNAFSAGVRIETLRVVHFDGCVHKYDEY